MAQMACLIVLGPIFEADLLDEQYGFREGRDAKEAIRKVYFPHQVWTTGGGRGRLWISAITSTRSHTAPS